MLGNGAKSPRDQRMPALGILQTGRPLRVPYASTVTPYDGAEQIRFITPFLLASEAITTRDRVPFEVRSSPSA